jgi:hypothetical protein
VLVLLVAAIYFRELITVIVLFERQEWKAGQRISLALQDPRSVVLTEFSGQVVVAKVNCTPDEIERLRRAVGRHVWPFVPRGPLCFDPHHRIEIVGADGVVTAVEICFLCGNFSFKDTAPFGELDLPPAWTEPLRSFFASVGMAPKTSLEYIDIALSGPDVPKEGEKSDESEKQ